MDALTRRAAILTTAAGVAAAAAPAWAQYKAAPGDMGIGNPKAPIHVVEYLSLTCPHCAHFHADVFPLFRAKYVDTGRVYFTVRELLTAPSQVAAAGFLLARCDGGKNYFKIVDEVFKSQSRWQGGQIKPIFVEIAKNNGLTEAQFEACITDDKAQEALQKRLEYATGTDKVTGTPTFFVNGVMLDNAEVPSLADLDAAIAKAAKLAGGRR
ncbi:MAG: DsbA family protein [Alphaproteobacteria bacterium]|nr:DsbA family protein [Alphaproteobacteria bacterium]MBU1515304.1 DsbA family protein [Alphaproteobacteria bacterium]MBU2094944.1 DsbA family protein [Alphaproteobacteria bacterium]MBU2151887.1 DsbA family protein [Alphaproteobacteria bacterium]MBU2310022.1 DsbA family protein [Alphaproteobacteria bacterium]